MKTDALISELQARLKIDESTLDAELQMQPAAYYEVSRALALAISKRDAAKQELQETEARVDRKIRLVIKEEGSKVTEKEIEARKTLNKDIKDAHARLLDLTYEVGKLSALKEAFSQRSYVLKDLVTLYVSEWYQQSNFSSAKKKRREES